MKEEILRLAEERARTDAALRKKSDMVQLYYDELEKRMHRKQRMWGGNRTVVTTETEQEPTSYRRALAFQDALEHMPIVIEPWAVIAGNCMEDGTIIRCVLPSFLRSDELGKCTLNMSHKCPDYAGLLADGIVGLWEKMKLQAETARKTGRLTEEQNAFVRAAEVEMKAVLAYARRYETLARSMAEGEPELRQKKNLLELADILHRVPAQPATSFREAIQSLWMINHIFRETMSYLSIGCIDRILYPYFEKDYLEGKITLEETQELVDVFCLRVNDRAQLDPENYVVDQKKLEGAPAQCRLDYNFGFVSKSETDEADAINHWGQNILISGIGAKGDDCTSVLTYLFLNAHEKLQMTDPTLTVRLHKNSPAELIERIAEVLKTGGGMPYINNDDILIPAYEKLGVSYEDACNYANSNCWETLLQGVSNQEMIRGINFLYLLELALNRGKSFVYAADHAAEPVPDVNDPMTFSPWCGPVNNVIDGIDTGDVGAFESIGDVLEAWKKQMDYMLGTCIREFSEEIYTNGSHGPFSSNPLLSVLTKDCVEKLTDTCHRGARYDLWHILCEAVSNAADAAAAIQKFVFEEKVVTLPDLVVNIGKRIGASADGRKSHEPIAANMSPVPSRDISGPTAAINSYLKLNTSSMAAGAPIDLRVSINGLEGEEGTRRIAALVETFIEMGGNMMTLTITSVEELRRAMENPEKYRGLRVRMGGWSAYYTLLSKESQKIHLKRVEHGLV